MLVQALADYAKSQLSDQLSDPAFESKPVSLALSISADGTFLGWIPYEESIVKGKKTVKVVPPQVVPKSPVNRNSGCHPLLAFDDAKYLFGCGDWTKPGQEEDHEDKHRAFVSLIDAAFVATKDEGLAACVAFYSRPEEVERARQQFDAKVTGGAVFYLYPDGPVTRRPKVEQYWRDHYRSRFSQRNEAGGSGMCLVTGEFGAIAPTHDKIKGAASIGGQPAGVALMSFDKDAFESYGWKSCANSPVSPASAQAYVLALNHLLAGRGSSRVDHNGVAHLFWLRNPSGEFDPMRLLEDADPKQVADLFHLRASSFSTLNPNDFYLLSVSGNGGRLVVRQWVHESLATTLAHVTRWFEGLRIVNAFEDGYARAPKHWELLACLARDEPPARRAIELFQRALLGKPLGLSLLGALLTRLRVSQGPERLNSARAALLRLVVNDQISILSKGDVLMNPEVNPGDTNPAYLCGRLLALFDSLQYRASEGKLNRSVADRYYSLASANPSLAFPKLEELGFKHLRKLQRAEKAGIAGFLDRKMLEIRQALGNTYPGPLSLIDQGRFALGFHHQRAEAFQAADKANSRKVGSNDE